MNIQIDEFGFCNLNQIWKDKGLPEKDKPWRWLRLGKTQELIHYYDTFIQTPNLVSGGKSAAYAINGGNKPSIYANEMLTLDWAAWVSPALRCEIYREYLERHSLVESVSKYIQLKADALDAMCNKGSTMTVTEAACQISKVVGYNISCRWLNDFLCEDHYKFKHWYDQKSGGGRKSNWIQEVKIRKYVDESYSIDKFGNRHKQLRITSRGAQYLAEWLNRYHAVFPRKP